MHSEFRVDSHRFDGRAKRRDGRGFLVVPGAVTRTGVLTYKRADGTTVRELRHPDDVFESASLTSLDGASITELHPSGFVDPGNAATHEVGIVGAGRRDGAFVVADLSIRRAGTIGKVERGELVELSCSYTLDIDPTPGTYEGQRYDQRQRNIRINHVALGPKGWGRGGADLRIRMDSNSAVLASASTYYDDTTTGGTSMRTREQQRFDEERRRVHDDFDRQVDAVHRRLDGGGVPEHERAAHVESYQRSDESHDEYVERRLDAFEEREAKRIPALRRSGVYER